MTGRSAPRGEVGARAGLVGVQLMSTIWWWIGLPTGFPLDDAWIHQVVARHFAEQGQLTFGAGVTGGSTSLVWSALLAPAHLFGALDPVLYTRVLGAVLLALASQGLYGAARSDGWTPGRAWTLGAGAVASGNVLWFAFSGMETALVLALTCGSVAAWRGGSTGWASLLSAALVFTRPEGVLVPLVMAAVERDRRRRLALAAAAVLAAAALGMVSWWLSGAAVPSTMAGRRWLYGFGNGPSMEQRWLFLAHWAVHLLRFSSGGMVGWGLVLAVLAIAGGRQAWRTRSAAVIALCACALAVTVLYAVVLPVIGHAGRYQPLNAVLFTGLAAAGAVHAAERAGLKAPVLGGAALVLVVALTSGAQWRGILHAGVTHIELTQHAMGRWLLGHLAAGDRVAVFDIGAIGYEIGARLADVSGLADREAVTHLREGTLAGYLQRRGIDRVVLPNGNPRSKSAIDILGLRVPGLHLEPVHTETSSPALWAITWESTYAAWPSQTLYRLVWTGVAR